MPISMPSTPEQWCVAASAVCAALAVLLGLVHVTAKLSRRLRTPAAVKLVRNRQAAPVTRVITPAAALVIPTDPWPAAPIPPPRRALQKPRLADPYVEWPTRRVPAVTVTVPVVIDSVVVEPAAAAPAGRGRLVARIRGLRRDVHQGAVPGWSPMSDVAAVDTADRLTPMEFLPCEPLMDGLPVQAEPSTDVIRDDVHHALESIDTAIAAFRRGVDASTVLFERNVDAALVVFDADRKAKLRAVVAGELTGEMDLTELRAALNAVPKAELVAA